MRGIFGWSLPPGVTNSMIEDQAGANATCEVCGRPVDDCICPECGTCQSVGDPLCYREHGLTLSPEQIESKALADREAAAQAAMEIKMDRERDGRDE
jgi:hypothetical protein